MNMVIEKNNEIFINTLEDSNNIGSIKVKGIDINVCLNDLLISDARIMKYNSDRD